MTNDSPPEEKGRPTFWIDGIEFGEGALKSRTIHAAVLGRIFTSWSLIEGCIASLLGLMIHADHRAAMAILETFRTNSSRVGAVRKVAKSMLTPELQIEFDALMKEVLAYADERNKIAHSLWGANDTEDGLVYRMPMSVVQEQMVDARMPVAPDAEKIVADLKAKMVPFTVADLEAIEKRGADVMKKVMAEAAQKRFKRTVELHAGTSI